MLTAAQPLLNNLATENYGYLHFLIGFCVGAAAQPAAARQAHLSCSWMALLGKDLLGKNNTLRETYAFANGGAIPDPTTSLEAG